MDSLTLHEYIDQNKSLHLHAAVSAAELHSARFRVREALYERVIDQMARGLGPLFREKIETHIDWPRIRKAVEDEIIRRAVTGLS